MTSGEDGDLLPAIIRAGHPVLRQEAQDVPASMLGSDELLGLVNKMIKVMRAAPGVGLAAPQIGVPLKVVVLEDRPEYLQRLAPEAAAAMQRSPFDVLALVNPVITALDGEGARFAEGCLSVPGYKALVERYVNVKVEGLTPAGEPLRLAASGWQARILQHELDHLRGTLYVDRMLTRSFASSDADMDLLPEDVPRPGLCKCCHAI